MYISNTFWSNVWENRIKNNILKLDVDRIWRLSDTANHVVFLFETLLRTTVVNKFCLLSRVLWCLLVGWLKEHRAGVKYCRNILCSRSNRLHYRSCLSVSLLFLACSWPILAALWQCVVIIHWCSVWFAVDWMAEKLNLSAKQKQHSRRHVS